MDLFATVEALPLAAALRGSVWAYPLVNAGHILGVAILFGSILVLDLRLLGRFRDRAPADLAGLLVPVAMAGFAIAATAGVLLFITDAADYAASGLFRTKMVLVLLALGNAVLFRRVAYWDAARETAGALPMRLAGATSLVLWLGVLVLGRLVGYF